MEPMTIPAIAPPDRPLLAGVVAGAAGVGEEEGKSVGMLPSAGRETFAHRLVTFEL